MTLLADFDIAEDLKVEFYIPDNAANLFIIGVSDLGGTNVLAGAGWFIIGVSEIGGADVLAEGAYAFDWQNLNCDVANVKTELGGTVENMTYFQAQPSTAAIALQSYTYDPTNNRTIRPGTPVRVRLNRAELDEVIFSGFINTVDVSYTVDGLNLISISALDSFNKVVTTRLAEFDTTTDFPDGYATPYEVIEKVAEGFGTSMYALSSETTGRIPSVLATDVIPNFFLSDAIQVGLGFFWIDPPTQEFVFIPRPVIAAIPDGTYTIGNSHEDDLHLCMSDLIVQGEYDDVYNSLRVALKTDDATYVIRQDQDSIDLYGVAAIDVQIDTTDIDQLNVWADRVFTQYPTRLVKSVTTPAIDRNNNLTHAAEIMPGEVLGVKYVTSEMNIDSYYSVAKVIHTIDVNNWFTRLELWKEA